MATPAGTRKLPQRRALHRRLFAAALTCAPVLWGCQGMPSPAGGDRVTDSQARTIAGGRQLDVAMQEYQAGNIEQALHSTRRARQADPTLVGAYELEALLQADLGNQDEYVNALRTVVAMHPQSAQLQSSGGRMLIAAGHRPEGLEAMQRAVRLAPRESTYARDLAGTYLNAGDLTTAAAVLAAAQVHNPDDTSLAVSLARLYEAAGDWQRAAENYRVAIEREPRNAVWQRQNAKCVYRLQQFQRAADEFQRCLETDIAVLTIADQVEFSDACLRCGDLKRAQWLLDRLIEQGCDTREVAVLRGVCALRRDAPAEAEQIFEQAATRWPDDPSLALLLDNSRQAQSRVVPTSGARLPTGFPVVPTRTVDLPTASAAEWLPPVSRIQR